MANAPVCNISVNEVINQPPGVKLPSIPQATDLPSALSAIQAMTDMLNILVGNIPNTRGQPGRAGQAGQPGKNPKNSIGRFTEVSGSRVTEKVKVTNPQDSSQFVEVERINKVVMRDNVTGEQWIWTL